jgi:homoserine dehydrogenase
MMTTTVTVGMAGFGTVGKSLARILVAKKDVLETQFGIEISIVTIFEYDGMLHDDSGLDLEAILADPGFRNWPQWTEGSFWSEEIASQHFDVFVDLTPTNAETGEPAFTNFVSALESGKHVVSANKGPFMWHYTELMDLAATRGKKVMFEATVGSAIPVINAAKHGIPGNRVLRIEAILNGTSNYILTRMANEKMEFNLALKEAQERGFAEANPTLDIDGHDAAGKLVILANLFMNANKTKADVAIEGIRHVNMQAIEMAEKEGFVIKHLGIADVDGTLEVRPKLVPKYSALGASVTGTLNAIKLVTDLAKELIFTGRGAGGMEAASAVLADLINLFRQD